jgi:HK97 family phage major capsid protein/HK97 family phage prohead protease
MPIPSKLCLRSVEFRAATDDGAGDDGRTLEGYAAVFNEATEIDSYEGRFDEEIAPGAFKKTISERKPVLQFDHGKDVRTGSVPIGKIVELREDPQGLYVQARLFDNPVVEPIRQAIEGGAISGMSFRFRVVRDEWRDAAGDLVRPGELNEMLYDSRGRGPLKRTIKEVQLFEAGPVVFPAYEQTTVGVRSVDDLTDEERASLVEQYRRSMTDDEETRAEDSDEKVSDSQTEEDERSEQTPTAEDAAGTSGADSTVTPEKKTETKRDKTVRKESVMDNMTVEERVARQSEIKARLSEIDTEYSGATLPEDTQREWDSLNTEFGEHDDAIEAATRRAAQLRALAEENANTNGNSRQVERGSQRPVRRPANIYDMAEIRSQARSYEEMGQLCRDNALRAVEQARFSGEVRREDAQERIERLLVERDDEQGTLARRILATGSPVYERAFGKAMKALNTNGLTAEEARALSLGSNADGGYAVPFQLDPTVILTSDGVINPLRSMARVVQITGKEWQGLTSAGVTVSRSNEAAEVSAQSPQFDQPTVKATRVTGFIPFSVELDSDWAAMRSEVTRILQDAKDTEEATSFVTGNGTGNQPGGVVATLSHYAAVPDGGTFSSADIYALEEALAPRWRSRAQFLGAKTTYNDIRNFATTDGPDLWVRLADKTPSQLIGYDAREITSMAGPTGTNRYLLFGDFSQFLIVDRVGMSVELVPHLFGTSNNYPTGQRGLLAIWRNSSKVLVDDAFRFLVHGSAS